MVRLGVRLPRRWYTDVIAPPKDFVLLVDKSADMAEKLSTAKDVAKLLIRTANSRDSVSQRKTLPRHWYTEIT